MQCAERRGRSPRRRCVVPPLIIDANNFCAANLVRAAPGRAIAALFSDNARAGWKRAAEMHQQEAARSKAKLAQQAQELAGLRSRKR